uniref:Thiamin biosynthesis protein S n=1 Tax=Crouania attenuata TaxID=42002 RepID=A0A4D6WQR4_9FLOR|nr:Thiamin biosynthesis protein S [Crouania attenuata]
MICKASIQEKYFSVFVNGEIFNCLYKMSLQDFLLYLNYDLSLIVIEYNKQIIPKCDWGKLILSSGDSIEIITIVGGG